MKKVLVAGATGFIGRHLTAELVRKGYDVTLLVRKTSDRRKVEEHKIVFGDITDPNLKLEGFDTVYDLVGVGSVAATSEKAFREFSRVNADGARNLLEKTNGGKFIYFSSLAAMGVRPGKTLDETTECMPSTAYEKSKLAGEKVVQEFAEKGRKTVILRPAMVYGEGDASSEVARMCRMVEKGMFPVFGDGRNVMSMTHVSNVVQAAILAGEKAATGTFIITDDRSYTLNEIVEAIGQELGRKGGGAIHLPVWIAKAAGLFFEVCQVFGMRPPLTRERARSMTSDRMFSISRAKKELGYSPISLKEGMKRTVAWYKKEGLL